MESLQTNMWDGKKGREQYCHMLDSYFYKVPARQKTVAESLSEMLVNSHLLPITL